MVVGTNKMQNAERKMQNAELGKRDKGNGKTNLYLSFGKSPRPSSLFPKAVYSPRRRRR